MRGACIRLSRMMPVPLRLPHNYTPVFFNTLDKFRAIRPTRRAYTHHTHCCRSNFFLQRYSYTRALRNRRIKKWCMAILEKKITNYYTK